MPQPMQFGGLATCTQHNMSKEQKGGCWSALQARLVCTGRSRTRHRLRFPPSCLLKVAPCWQGAPVAHGSH